MTLMPRAAISPRLAATSAVARRARAGLAAPSVTPVIAMPCLAATGLRKLVTISASLP